MHFLSNKKNIFYLNIPGTSEVPKQLINKGEKIDDVYSWNDLMRNPQFSKYVSKYENIYLISKVVNPLERVYNFYNDETIMSSLPLTDEIKSSFSNFVKFLFVNKDKYNEEPENINLDANIYIDKKLLVFRPQLYYLSNKMNHVDVNLLIKNKETDDDKCKMIEMIGDENNNDNNNDNFKCNKMPIDFMVEYTDELIKMVYMTYFKDFNQFDFKLHKVPPSYINYPIKDNTPQFALITPTLGNNSLLKLVKSLQYESTPFIHLIMWDKNRIKGGLTPSDNRLQDSRTFHYELTHPYHKFPGQRNDVWLRAVGANMVNTPFVGFFDDDTWPDRDHLKEVKKFLCSPKNKTVDYTFVKRRMWEDINKSGNLRLIGNDNFESTGEMNEFGYKMIDNSSIYLKTKTAWSLSQMFMSYQKYGDDRLTADYLEKNNFKCKPLNMTLINHIAKPNLVPFFIKHCS